LPASRPAGRLPEEGRIIIVTEQLGTTPSAAAQVVLATIGIYLVLTVLVRLVGQRSLSALSGTDVACVIALGAVVGRTALLAVPSLITGVLVLVVLVGLQRLLAGLGRVPRIAALMNRDPVLLISDGRQRPDALRRARVSEDELRQCLRLAGVTHRRQVRMAVLERNGQISILRSGDEVEPWLLDDLPGVDGHP
jgi:uncharacterized membrane protein YcaP (DUF421 family)